MKVQLPNKELEVELADTMFKRALGLSFRTEGKMLFRFPRETRVPIDMMLMRKSLYLYFLNSRKEIMHMEKAEPWYTIPNKFFHRPQNKYKYLLESFEELEVDEGEKLVF